MDVGQDTHHLIDIHKYVERRSAQVSELLQVVDNRNLVSGEVTKGPRTAAQRLPRHMRRRAMAYEIKRFPRGIRDFALSVAVPSKHRKKPPCRYYRRRSRNLLLNYIRRQKRAVWLETHIWHAKRFHMVNRWGYRLPDRSFQRNFRPCYRDSVRHSSVRDKSFLTCLVINTTDQTTLINLLKPLCNEKVSPTFAFRSGLSGRYEVNSLLYEPNQYPKGFIGPIRFLWSTVSNGHTLTIWTHPSSRERLKVILSELLKLNKSEGDSTKEDSCPLSVDDWRLASMNIMTDIYKSADSSIELFDLRDQMIRFRLYGPLSMAIIANSIRLVDDESSELYSESHTQWQEHFSKLNIGEVRDSAVFSLLIEDPRINRVGSKRVPWPEACDVDPEEHCIPVGQLWDRSTRLQTLEKKLSDIELKKLMGSSVGAVRTTECKIPIVIIVRNSGDGHASPLTGLEVIAPAGFGPALWISLQMNTARASGIRDDLAAHLESNRLHYPTDAVDSCSGSAELLRIQKESEERHSKRPHNRRVDYWKAMSVKYPFAFEFNELVSNWKAYLCPSSPNDNEAYVLRDRLALQSIDNWLRGKSGKPENILNSNSDALIPVRVELCSRGKPRKFGLICLPVPTDLSRNANIARPTILQSPRSLIASVQNAESNSLPKQSDDEFWKDVVSTDYSKHETPISLKNLFPDSTTERSLKRKALNRRKRENKKKRKMDLEERLRTLNDDVKEMESTPYRVATNRLTVGRIVRGDYSFKSGKGVALGYVPAVTLQQLVSSDCKVLLRNSTSKYYHLGKLDVLKTCIEI